MAARRALARSAPPSAGWIAFVWEMAFAVFIVVADRLTKLAVTSTMFLDASREITPFFNIVHARNTGAAFSLLAQAGGWQRWMFVGIALAAAAVFLWLMVRNRGKLLFAFGAALMMGGAVGNLIDRLWYGWVIDFLDFHLGAAHWPAFNIADVGVCLGAAMIVLDELWRVNRS